MTLTTIMVSVSDVHVMREIDNADNTKLKFYSTILYKLHKEWALSIDFAKKRCEDSCKYYFTRS